MKVRLSAVNRTFPDDKGSFHGLGHNKFSSDVTEKWKEKFFEEKGAKKFHAGRNLIFLVGRQVDKIGLIDIK